ncbi:hypothetical protein MTO96_048729 [Rhipicephalus appendiculatus]
MEGTDKGLRTCFFVLQCVAVFAAGASAASLRDSLALSDGIREVTPPLDSPLSDGICVAAPSLDPDLLATACWNLTKVVERHLQHHQCAAATSTSSRLERIRPSIDHYPGSGHGGAMDGTAKGLRTCFFVLQRFFGIVRCIKGDEDHPSITQFSQIYRFLSLYTPLKTAIKGNCTGPCDSVLVSFHDSLGPEGESGS